MKALVRNVAGAALRPLHTLAFRLSRKPAAERWRRALPEEVEFWRSYVYTRGGHFPQEYRDRLNGSRPLPGFVQRLVPPTGEVALLDVGSGPLTSLSTGGEARISVTAVDPLAHQYSGVLQEAGVKAPFPTIYGEAEDLPAAVGDTRFDIVHARNAIDHTYDPVRALTSMLAVTKPGGWVAMIHIPNEGASEGYQQLHQWASSAGVTPGNCASGTPRPTPGFA